MKLLISCVFVLLVCKFSYSLYDEQYDSHPYPYEVPGILISTMARDGIVAPPRVIDYTCGPNVGPLCANDCKTFMVCAGQKNPIAKWNCSDYTSKATPYCVNHACVAKPDPNNSNCGVSTSYRCTSEGIFPDPDDCTRYYSCDDQDTNAQTYQCPNGFVFFSETKLCRPRSIWAQCQTVNCQNKKNKLIPFDSNPSYYAFCGETQKIMFKCSDDQSLRFDPITNECIYWCKRVGDFVDKSDCTKYVTCQQIFGGFKPIVQSCPTGFYFNQTQCVFGTCKKPATVTTLRGA